MRLTTATLALIIALAGCDTQDGVVIHDGWVRAAPPTTTMTAGYMTIDNRNDRSIVLTAVSSPDYAIVEFHETLVEDGISKMRRVETPTIGSGATWTLEPGGAHLMLMRPSREIRAGDSVNLILEFDIGEKVQIDLQVMQAQADSTQ